MYIKSICKPVNVSFAHEHCLHHVIDCVFDFCHSQLTGENGECLLEKDLVPS